MMTMNKLFLCIAGIFIVIATSVQAEEYIVQKGDTLLKITQEKLGDKSRWQEVAALNGIKKPYSLNVGQTISIPSAELPAENSDISHKQDSNIPFWIWATVILLSCWLFNSACLRISCWFSLVDTTFIHCALFALLSSTAMVLCCGAMFGLSYLALQSSIPWVVIPIAGATLLLIYVIVILIALKRVFSCKWRSIITISFMYILVSNVLSFIPVTVISVVLPDLMNTSAVEKYIEDVIEMKK